jgi:hypothetical protein
MAKKSKALQPVEAPKQLIRLDIASGQNCREGFTGIDLFPGSDIVHNLNHYPWPIADASVSEAHCSHYVEHIPTAYWHPGNKYSSVQETAEGQDALCKFFDELYRILAPGAQTYIIAPYYSSQRCWQDPTHRRAICDATFFYVSKEWRTANKLDHYGMSCDFHATWGYGFEPELLTRNDEYRQHAVRHDINAVQDIHVTLTKK